LRKKGRVGAGTKAFRPSPLLFKMTLRGIVKLHQFGPRGWEFITEDGDHYELIGGDPGLYRDGIRAVVTGRIREDLMSAANLGPILEVDTFKQEEN